jgi:hypothetical protein
VDAFLQSERFGERWARHWLDVVRYADSVGRVWNAPFLYAARYRDWVIDSLNADKPYNRFVAEQIAGDLIPAKTVLQRRDQIVGTGMLALGSMNVQEGSYEQYILDQVDDQIDVVSRAFLGITIACARCHDHKTEPVSQKDYYALAGIFYSSRTLSGTPNRNEGVAAVTSARRRSWICPPRSMNPLVRPPSCLRVCIRWMTSASSATRRKPSATITIRTSAWASSKARSKTANSPSEAIPSSAKPRRIAAK